MFKQQLSETHTAAQKKEHLKKKKINVFDSHYCPHPGIQRAYDAAIWKTEIIWGEGRRHSEREGG